MESITEQLMEPLKYYYSNIKDNFSEKVAEFFNRLVEQSDIDIEHNKLIAQEYEKILEEKTEIEKKLSFNKKLSIFLIILGIILAVYGLNSLRINMRVPARVREYRGIIYAAIGIGMLIFRWTYVKKRIVEANNLLPEYEAKCEEKLNECYASMAPLNALMDSKYTFQLINENIPFIKLDPYFNMRRFEELYNRYGMSDNGDENYSALEAASGNILGNPFVLLKQLKHEIVDHTYTGSLTISWQESYTDNEGKVRYRTRTQTLRASVVKPKPEYSDLITLIFANDVAPDLCFSREPGHAEQLSERALEKKVKKEEKRLQKIEDKSIRKGESFVTMSNSEFDVLFNALDRNNETQFRLLFTPLAQVNIIEELKNKEYGDNFYFFKNKKINKIIAEHTKNWDVDCSVNKFRSYSYEKCRDFFVKFNVDYFNNFFFTMLPLISIPLYQQYMAEDYIYETEPENNYNPYMSETLANAMSEKYFVHPDTKTRAILKASPESRNGETDIVRIKAHTYDIEERVTYISVYGGDGRYHDVPVHWDNYIPLSNDSSIEVKKLGIADNDFDELAFDNSENEIFKEQGHYVYKNKIFATVGDSGNSENVLNSILRNLQK